MTNKKQIEEEALATYQRLVATRDKVDSGECGWDTMADFFTEDAVYIDPAWGRQEGRETIRQFFVDSMAGLNWSDRVRLTLWYAGYGLVKVGQFSARQISKLTSRKA